MDNSYSEIPDRPNDIVQLRERLFLVPQDVDAMRALAALLEQTGDLPGAIDLHQRALRVDPYRVEVLLDLGRLWNQLGDVDRARSWFTRALAIDPDCSEAAAGLAALVAADMLTPAYVRTLFDQYAERFDEDLTRTLKYQAPALAAAALERCGVAEGTAHILDLGCGTGLSGLALRRFAAGLDGTDLSPSMVEKARKRGIYDDLTVDEAEVFLARSSKVWDVVAAVDMLNYIGDLSAILRLCAARLGEHGLIVGTVEKREEGGAALTAKRRYVHGRDHLQAALDGAGLKTLEISQAVLRQEGGLPVAGLIFTACR